MPKYKIAAIIISQNLERAVEEPHTILLPEELDHFNLLISRFEDIGCDPIIVIAGQDPYYICKKEGEDSFTCYNNPDPEQEEMGALRSAVEQLPNEVFGFILAFWEDQKIKPETLRSIYAMAQHFPENIVIPRFHGRYGRPIYISRRFFEHLEQTITYTLPFTLVENYLSEVKFLPVNDETVLDVEDYYDLDENLN
ncbi:NTP transferase domain-containing protein [Calditrichota bacterium GD2]